MSAPNDQTQNAGDHSTNLQVAGSVIIKTGSDISYRDVRDIALDVFRGNFEKLTKAAGDIASKRAEEITDKFLKELAKDNPAGLQKAGNPDFQLALYTAQREFARTGDESLGNLLVALLVDRSKQHSRDIVEIVLTESLAVAPKLTTDQLATLKAAFYFRYSKLVGVLFFETLQFQLEMQLRHFADDVSSKQTCFQHLEFAGCATVSMGSVKLADVFQKFYPNAFSKGIQREWILSTLPGLLTIDGLFKADPVDAANMMITVGQNEEEIRKFLVEKNTSKESIDRLIQQWNSTLLSTDEIKKKIITALPRMGKIFEVWDTSALGHLQLTSVGIAIGHAYLKSRSGLNPELSIWIN